jgi:hypothetical protein
MNSNHQPDEINISLIDILQFLKASKYYCLIGATLGLLASGVYLFSVQPLYQSKITIDVNYPLNIPSFPEAITPEEIRERFFFSKSKNQLLASMPTKVTDAEKKALMNSLDTIKLTSSKKYIEVSLTLDSSSRTEDLLNELGEQIVLKVLKWNEHRLRYLSNLQKRNQAIIAQTKDNALITNLQSINAQIELLLESEDLVKPQILDGPSKAIQINSQPIAITLIKGLILGLSLALILAFLRMQWQSK